LVQIVFIHAGQHRHRQHNQRRIRSSSFHRPPHHLRPSTRVHGQHANPQPRSLFHRRSHSIGDVMVFQVEKHLPPSRHKLSNHIRPLGRNQPHPPLEGRDGLAHSRHDLSRGGCGRYVQSNN